MNAKKKKTVGQSLRMLIIAAVALTAPSLYVGGDGTVGKDSLSGKSAVNCQSATGVPQAAASGCPAACCQDKNGQLSSDNEKGKKQPENNGLNDNGKKSEDEKGILDYVGSAFIKSMGVYVEIFKYIREGNWDVRDIKIPDPWFVGLSAIVIGWRVLYLMPLPASVINTPLRPLRYLFYWLWLRPASVNKHRDEAKKDFKKLLPGQKDVVWKVAELLRGMSLASPGRMIGMEASWGGGKSYVVNYLSQHGFSAALAEDGGRGSGAQLSNDGGVLSAENVIVVQISAWGEQTEHDLHLSMMKAVFGHPEFFVRYVALYPFRMLVAPLLTAIAIVAPKGIEIALGGTKVAVGEKAPLPMVWQNVFASVIRRAVDKGLRLVMIIDEIDRCEPPIAQAAITMARRALDMPGILTLVPYVERQIEYSVFNPAQAILPDLRAAIFGVLSETVLAAGMGPGQDIVLDSIKSEAGMQINRMRIHDKNVLDNNDNKIVDYKTMQENYLLSVYWFGSLNNRRWKRYVDKRFREKYLSDSFKVFGLDSSGLAQFMFSDRTTFHADLNYVMNKLRPDIREYLRIGIGNLMAKGFLYDGVRWVEASMHIGSIRKFQGYFADLMAIYRRDFNEKSSPHGLLGADALTDKRNTALLSIRVVIVVLLMVALSARAVRDKDPPLLQ